MENRQPNYLCAVCDKPIYRRPAQVAKRKNPPTCSHKCSNKQVGVAMLHTPEARAKRTKKLLGELNPDWKGGRYVEPKKGYVMIRNSKHPRARHNGYVLEHILVAEQMLGRPLLPGEEIHHINEKRSDNRPENLKIYSTHSEHFQTHLPLVPATQDVCSCGKKVQAKGLCSRCYAYKRRTGKMRVAVCGDLRHTTPAPRLNSDQPKFF